MRAKLHTENDLFSSLVCFVLLCKMNTSCETIFQCFLFTYLFLFFVHICITISIVETHRKTIFFCGFHSKSTFFEIIIEISKLKFTRKLPCNVNQSTPYTSYNHLCFGTLLYNQMLCLQQCLYIRYSFYFTKNQLKFFPNYKKKKKKKKRLQIHIS